MHRLSIVAALALAAACSSTSIEGKVVVGPGHEGLAVVAVLWQNQLVPLEPSDPNSEMAEQLVALSQLAVGTATAEGGEFPYMFHSVSKGEYVVGAFIDMNDDREVTNDEIAVDLAAPFLEIDPDDENKRTASRDIYIGLSAPDRVTLSGVLHRSAVAAARPAEILVLDGPLSDPEAMVVARQVVPAGKEDAAWTLFNVPDGALHVLAVDDLSLGGLVALHAGNPVRVEAAKAREVTGVDLWMDRQAPGLGSVSGEVTLNGALPTAALQLWLFADDPTRPAGAEDPPIPIVGWVNASAASTMTVPFTFRSVPLRKLYLAAAIVSTEAGGGLLTTTRVYSLGESATLIELSQESPSKEALVFPMGVGRISGSITLENAKKGLPLWTVALVDGPQGPTPHQYDVFFAPADGNLTMNYDMFGLEDGTYTMQVVPDTTGVDGPNDEIASGFYFTGTPAQVQIVGGDRVASDFTVKLQSTP